MRTTMVALALGLMALPLAAQDVAPLPGFLLGKWVQREGEKWADETWSGSAEGLRGTSRAGSGETVRSRESLTIERRGGGIVLIAQPDGAQPVEFAMVAHDATSVEFANPAHDYPQRIRYWREGDRLRAEISLIGGGQAVGWSYVAAAE